MAEKPGREIPRKVAKTDEEKALINRDNTVRNCPVCNNGDLAQIHQIGRYTGMNRVYCGRCGVAYFSLPLPTTIFYGPHYNRFFFNPQDMAAAVTFAGYVRELADVFGQNIRGLEIGPGSGYTVQSLNLMGYNFEGIEMDKKWADEISYKLNIRVYSGGFLKFNPGYRYDIICGSHVIEHFEDAQLFWLKLNELTKILGVVFLAAPDLDQSSNYHPQWFHFCTRHPYEHACVYGYRALEFATRNFGFELLKFDRFYNGNNWTAVLRKNRSLTEKGAELDKHADSPPFRLPSM